MEKKETYWSPLDNAAKIFPAIRSSEHTTVMRLTTILTEPITISCLYKAVKIAEKRFPYFIVRLRRGFFWYYLEQVDDPVIVLPDDRLPCRAFSENNQRRAWPAPSSRRA